MGSFVNIFEPRADRDRRRLRRRRVGATSSRAGARRCCGARRSARCATTVRSSGRARHRRPGLIGAAFVALRGARRGEVADAARRLRDADRQSRGRDAARARELREADVVLCEDTRHTRSAARAARDRGARSLSYHEHNEAARTAELLPRLEAGERIALVSDAGLPGVTDPGARIVRAALDAGVPVTVLPGPSAVETALVARGLVGERYQFLGFLPRGEKALAALWEELAAWPVAGGRVRVAEAAAGDAALARGRRSRAARSPSAAS